MKGIAKQFKIGDIESLFYFYICFIFLSEIFVIFMFKKLSLALNIPFNIWSCFFVLLIVPLVETFLLGLITEAFNYIFCTNGSEIKNNIFELFVSKTKMPLVFILFLFMIIFYFLLNIDELFEFVIHSDTLFLNLCLILIVIFLVGILILFVLNLFLSYKLKLKAMGYQLELEKQKAIRAWHASEKQEK
jgi:hypothetical protein